MSKLTAIADLEDLALELGASVRGPDGKVFNSAGRAGATRLPKVEAAPAAPVVRESDMSAKLMQMMAELMARQQAAPVVNVPEVKVPAPTVVVQPAEKAAPCSWKFSFERNRDGSIKSITASPVKE